MKLIIVESPTKAKTIGQFLGSGYKVESSYGHVRDLPKSKIGINTEANFEPTYSILPKAKEHVAVLKELASKADEIILASDEDREGEAIAWHLTKALDLDGAEAKTSKKKTAKAAASAPKKIERIVFHEITKQAIEEALKNPRAIDMNLVDAQQARRILDRLVGYELSPFLWRRVRYGLSAGRVQSVAVRLIVEREREIQAFNKEEYWSIEGDFSKSGSTPLTTGKDKTVFHARLISVDGESLGKMAVKSGDEAEKLVARLKGAGYRIKEVSSKEVGRNPFPPFTTSTLQQEASRKLGFSAKQTMMLAQNLYENGHITYMRTDSVNLAEQAVKQAKKVIDDEFGKNYSLAEPRRFSTKSKGAQEAHEAVRPTDLSKRAGDIKTQDRKQQRLYDLIWKRALASQMKEAVLEQTAADIETTDLPARGAQAGGKSVFRANGQRIVFDGFMKVYLEDEEGTESGDNILPKLEKGEDIKAREILPFQHFTEPPPRYTDASLIKTLEAAGIGRPSTYAPTLSTIQDRGYVEKIDKRYHPVDVGIIVNDILVEHFPEIVDVNFTSHIEEELDHIAEGKIKWTEVAREFYGPFKKHLIEKEAEVGRYSEISETPCPHCGKPMIVKFGRFGKFLACPDPENKVTLPMPEEAAKIKELQEMTRGEKCPICGKDMDIKRGRFGFFLGCSDYPKCKGIKKILKKTGFKCPNCQARLAARDGEQSRTTGHSTGSGQPDENLVGDIIEKKARGRGNAFYGCSRYPDCNFISNKKPETQQDVDEAFDKFTHAQKRKESEQDVAGTVGKKSKGRFGAGQENSPRVTRLAEATAKRAGKKPAAASPRLRSASAKKPKSKKEKK
ncbi:MAG TPA: type I DNA topoisomerase [Candidatus Paceibacterota bacterium]|nr:type I DNA topoisomerase [Candidatus Paceibacterota bacterium]